MVLLKNAIRHNVPKNITDSPLHQGVFFSAYRRISADFPRIFDPSGDQYKSGEKVDQYVGGYAFYKHLKLPKNGQKQSFSAPEIHCQNPP